MTKFKKHNTRKASAVSVDELMANLSYAVSLRSPAKIGRSYFETKALADDSVTPYDMSVYSHMYWTIGYVNRAVQLTVSKMCSRGYTVIASDPSEQEALDKFIEYSEFDQKLSEILTNVCVYGFQLIHMFDTADKVLKKNCPISFVLIPSKDVDFIRDVQNYIEYDRDGKVVGYKQIVNGIEKQFPRETNCYLAFNTFGNNPQGYSMLHPLVKSAYIYEYLRDQIPEVLNRNLPSMVFHTPGGKNDNQDVMRRYGNPISTRSVIAVGPEWQVQNITAGSTHIPLTDYADPCISEIAAAMNIPMSLLAATSSLKSSVNDTDVQMKNWYDSIEIKQRIIADQLESQLFSKICPSGVKFVFKSPNNVEAKTVGYLIQSGATYGEAYNICNGEFFKLEDSDICPKLRGSLDTIVSDSVADITRAESVSERRDENADV